MFLFVFIEKLVFVYFLCLLKSSPGYGIFRAFAEVLGSQQEKFPLLSLLALFFDTFNDVVEKC